MFSQHFSKYALRSALLVGLGVLVAGVALPGAEARAADCYGGSVDRIRVTQRSLRYTGTVTIPRVTRDSLASAPEGFRLVVVDAEDASEVLASVQIDAARFVSKPKSTIYDGAGSANGRIRLRDLDRQADSVHISVKLRGTFDPSIATSGTLRGYIDGGADCTRSCVSACSARRGGRALYCQRSAIAVPSPEEGYGELLEADERVTDLRSRVCGLALPTGGPRCEFLIDETCLLPYPSSVFLDQDPSTATGLRMHYDVGSLPANASAKPIDPSDWNTLDGFSPGPMIMALFPDSGFPIDLAASGAAPVTPSTDFGVSLGADHPTAVVRAADSERVVHLVEMDSQTDDVEKKALIIRPGERLDDATRYLVGIRGLVDTVGTPVLPRLAFRVFRDAIPDEEVALACGVACSAALASRRASMESVFAGLTSAGVGREDLVLAWDFTTASTEALTDWMVAVRDQAFALGTPSFTVDSVDDGGGAGRNAEIFARIEGTFQAPLFMSADAPGSRLNVIGGTPVQNGFATVPYVVDVPRIAVASENPSATPARGTLWGHGLLGTRYQLGTLSPLAAAYNFVVGAVDMQGMSDPDVNLGIIPAILDLSLFHRVPERLHQGVLNHLLLGRLMNDPSSGFGSHPAFGLGQGGASVIDTDEVFYSGGSQGGIFGGVIMGVTHEFSRGFLAVPAANYSTLLRRSIDFEPFFALLQASYSDPLDETLLYALMQQLWDRAEPQAYLPHILPGTLSDPAFPHEVLVHMATYDSEVSNLATEIMVRSLGIPQLRPVHRSFFAIPEVDAPTVGSVFVEIDPQLGGSRCHTPGTTDRGAPCISNSDCPGAGDPAGRTECASGVPPLVNDAPLFNNGAHGSTGSIAAGAQIEAFLRNAGTVEQFCTGPCDPN